MKFTTKQVKDAALEIIASNPGGVRYSALVTEILRRAPETPKNTIQGSIWNLDVAFPQQVAKPSRGVFAPANIVVPPSLAVTTFAEAQFAPQGVLRMRRRGDRDDRGVEGAEDAYGNALDRREVRADLGDELEEAAGVRGAADLAHRAWWLVAGGA